MRRTVRRNRSFPYRRKFLQWAGRISLSPSRTRGLGTKGRPKVWSGRMPALWAGVCLGNCPSWRNPYASSVLGVKTNPTVHKYTANQSSMSRYLLARGQNWGKFHMERPRTVPEHLGHTSVASAYGHFASIFLKLFGKSNIT